MSDRSRGQPLRAAADLHQAYRPSYVTLVLWMVAAFAAVDFARLAAASGFSPAGRQLLNDFPTITFVSLVFSAFFALVLRSDLSADGLRSYTLTGHQEFIPWQGIMAADRTNFLGLGFYRVDGGDGTRIYIPRYLSRQREFEVLVSAMTPEDNPFNACIAGR